MHKIDIKLTSLYPKFKKYRIKRIANLKKCGYSVGILFRIVCLNMGPYFRVFLIKIAGFLKSDSKY